MTSKPDGLTKAIIDRNTELSIEKRYPMTKPTEARQDELALWEKMAEKLCEFDGGYYPDLPEISTNVGNMFSSKSHYRRHADQILSLTVSSGGGVCPECKGTRIILLLNLGWWWLTPVFGGIIEICRIGINSIYLRALLLKSSPWGCK